MQNRAVQALHYRTIVTFTDAANRFVLLLAVLGRFELRLLLTINASTMLEALKVGHDDSPPLALGTIWSHPTLGPMQTKKHLGGS